MSNCSPTLSDVMAKLEAIERLLYGGVDHSKLRVLTAFGDIKSGEAYFVPSRQQCWSLSMWALRKGYKFVSAKTNGGYIVIRGRRPKQKKMKQISE